MLCNVGNSSANKVLHCLAELQVNKMCNAMEIEKAVGGEVNASKIVQTNRKDNGGNGTAALGHRPSQQPKDFFVPVSQRKKPSKKLWDEVDNPNLALPASVEKRKRGRPRKPSLEDNGEIQGHKTQDEEGKQVTAGSGPADQQRSQVTPCDDFFMPFSKRLRRKEDPIDKELDETGNVPSKPKSRKDGQVEKPSVENVHAVPMLPTLLGKANKSVSTRVPAKETALSISDSPVVPEERGLRLEAVLAAQENARLNSGKAPHPFFARKKGASLKASVPWNEVSTSQVEELQPGPPMHITQLSEDGRTEVVWPDWKVRSTSGDEGIKLEFSKMEQKRRRLMRLSAPSIWAKLDQRPDSHSFSTSNSELAGSPTLIGGEGSSGGDETTVSLKYLQDLLRRMQTLKMTTEAVGELAQLPDICADLSLESLKNRFSWYSARHESLKSAENVTKSQISKGSDEEALLSTQNLLWTDLYQPRSSKEVCGNTTAVEILNTWLYNWQLKITGQLVRGEDDNKGLKKDQNDDSDGWFEGDTDSDGEVDNETGLYNTLLVTGPEGCGKSAAVYACAGEQGFTVIEVNASDCRNGALIKQKFGEAMGSHGLGKGSQVGVESPEPASKKGLYTQENDPGQCKQNCTKQTKLFAEKRVGDRFPIKAQQDRLMASQDESQMESQSKRKTVILFEDVDKHFDEDIGFFTALVQLSKTTKRPIILTSNRHDPGLPPALGKYRVDFGCVTSEELVLHTSLVSIAEGVPFFPWLLERLVDSCHYDLRKVMMTLQFWGQGKVPLHQPSILGGPPYMVRIPNHLENLRLNGHGASNNLSLERKKFLKLNTSSKPSLYHKQGKGCFDHWESDARWLFELDVHHFILPKVIDGCFECPLTLLVGEKISTAVKELEEHMEQVAASESEGRARAKQAEYESIELTRKALKKEKDTFRRISQFNPRVLDDDGMNSLSLDEDEELENRCGENWTCSPVKGLREEKTLARSPLKSVAKPRRALLLEESDDDEQLLDEQPERRIEAGNQSISNVEIHLPGVQSKIGISRDGNAEVVSENLEDIDVIHSTSSEVVATVRRKRLGIGAANLNSFSVIRMVDMNEEAPSLKVEPWGVGTGEIVSKSRLVGFEVTPRILSEDGDLPLLVADVNDRLTTESNPSISGGFETSGSLQTGGQQSTQNFGSSGQNQMLSNFPSGVEQHLEDTAIATRARERPFFVEESNYVNESGLMSNHGLQSCYGEVLQDNKDPLQKSEVTVPPGDLPRGLEGFLPNVSDSPNKTVVGISLSTGLDDEKDPEGSVSPVFRPVNDAWASLQKSQQTPKLLLKHSETSADVASSLADLLDIVSASDVISSVEPEDSKDAWRNFFGNSSESFEGNIGHSSDWDSCQQIASQLVCTGLQMSLPFLPAVNHADDRSPALSCILECAKDASAVGKCMVTHSGLTRDSHRSSNLYGMVDNGTAKMNLTRQADRQARLEDVVQAAVFPRGRVSGSGFADYSTYLSRMSQLEEIRRTNAIVHGRRPRRFEHHLTSKLKSMSESDITELLNYSTFKRC